MSAARQQAISQLDSQIPQADILLAIQSGKAIPQDFQVNPSGAPNTSTTSNTPQTSGTPKQASTQFEINKLLKQQQLQAQLNAKKFGAKIKKFGKDTSYTLGRIPIPGGVGVPLTILLLLFIVLIPVNGHTRITWLWLALTGNALIRIHPDLPFTDTSRTGGNDGGTGSGGSITVPQGQLPTAPTIIALNYADIMSGSFA